MSGDATRLITSKTKQRGKEIPPHFFSGTFAALLELKRAEFSMESAFVIFLFDLMAFVQYDENPKNAILGLDKSSSMMYTMGVR